MKPRILVLWLSIAAFAQDSPTRILITWHSETGNTEKLAREIAQGVRSVSGVEAVTRKTAEVTREEILRADGILLGTPVHWQNASQEAKQFIDRVGEALGGSKTLGEGRTAGAFCTGGGAASGKDLARLSILAAFLGMRFVVIGGLDAEGYGTTGTQATTGPDDPGLSGKELEEARRFGERFARLTRRFRSGTP